MPIAQSSHLQEYDYDPDSQTLRITFQNGAIYEYYGVPQNEFWALQRNGGSGTYFHARIRNQFRFAKVFDPGAE